MLEGGRTRGGSRSRSSLEVVPRPSLGGVREVGIVVLYPGNSLHKLEEGFGEKHRGVKEATILKRGSSHLAFCGESAFFATRRGSTQGKSKGGKQKRLWGQKKKKGERPTKGQQTAQAWRRKKKMTNHPTCHSANWRRLCEGNIT